MSAPQRSFSSGAAAKTRVDLSMVTEGSLPGKVLGYSVGRYFSWNGLGTQCFHVSDLKSMFEAMSGHTILSNDFVNTSFNIDRVPRDTNKSFFFFFFFLVL